MEMELQESQRGEPLQKRSRQDGEGQNEGRNGRGMLRMSKCQRVAVQATGLLHAFLL